MTRLYRSTRDKVMTGLAGGLADTLGIDSTLLRIILLVSIPFTGGGTILAYFIAALIIPKESHYNPFGPGPGGPYSGNYTGRPGYGPEGHGGQGPYGHHPGHNPHFDKNHTHSAPDSGLDAMMKDIEKKALQKEVEELRQKLSKYEKGEV
ncbi:PspC domain-containing protein [Paenibacillus sp. sgz500958]|uniref:PspC domain-containing protein n=1 Tax=Paenibacillus sp. sgz500958 TaxID=3242475 RepID=UPI0036D33D16